MVHNCYYKGLALGWFLGLRSACVCKWSDVRSNVPNMSTKLSANYLNYLPTTPTSPQCSTASTSHHRITTKGKRPWGGEKRSYTRSYCDSLFECTQQRNLQ